MDNTPAEILPIFYQADTFGYTFKWTESGDPFDLTQLDDIIFRMFDREEVYFDHSLSDEDITISGNDNNLFTGSVSSETMDIPRDIYFVEVKFRFAGTDPIITYAAGIAKVVDAEDMKSTTGKEWEIDINTSAQTAFTESFSGLLAFTIQASEDAEQARDDTQDIADQALIDITDARDNALTQIDTAETDATTAIEQAETEGITAVENARDQGVIAVENARDSAISTINGLVSDAEDARDAAQTAASNAATSETNAANSVSAAATSESNASDSATIATDEADRAETQADRAEAEAGSAEQSAIESEQEVIDAHGYYEMRLQNLETRIRDLES